MKKKCLLLFLVLSFIMQCSCFVVLAEENNMTFIQGVIARFDAETEMVNIAGRVDNVKENQTVTILALPGGTDIENFSVWDIIYTRQVEVKDNAFNIEFKFSKIPDGVIDIYLGGTGISTSVKTDVVPRYDYVLIDSLDVSLSDVTATAYMKNYSDTDKTATMILAQYDEDGQLLDMSIEGKQIPADTFAPVKHTLSSEELNAKASCVKAFVWDGTSTMIPLTLPVEKNTGEDLLAYNLVTTFCGDGGTTRGFAWNADKEHTDMAIRYIQEDGRWAECETIDADYTVYGSRIYYKAEINNLIPGETYKYKIGDKEDKLWSEAYTFTTEPENLTEFSFIGVTDPQSSSWSGFEYYQKTLDKAFGDDDGAAFMVNLGDMVNDGRDTAQWDYYFEAVKGYAESIPHMAVIGNHETIGDESDAAKKFSLRFNNPDNGADAFGNLTASDVSTARAKGVINNVEDTVYSFDYGNAHFAVLNSVTDGSKSDHTKIMNEQAKWLDKDLEATDKKWKIVMVHIGMYPAKAERYDSRDALTEVIDKHGVDLVLSGHDHMVARTYPMKNKAVVQTSNPASVAKGTGMISTILGVAGTKRYDEITEKPNYLAVLKATASKQPTYSLLTVNDEKISVVTKQLNGTVVDSFEIVDK